MEELTDLKRWSFISATILLCSCILFIGHCWKSDDVRPSTVQPYGQFLSSPLARRIVLLPVHGLGIAEIRAAIDEPFAENLMPELKSRVYSVGPVWCGQTEIQPMSDSVDFYASLLGGVFRLDSTSGEISQDRLDTILHQAHQTVVFPAYKNSSLLQFTGPQILHVVEEEADTNSTSPMERVSRWSEQAKSRSSYLSASDGALFVVEVEKAKASGTHAGKDLQISPDELRQLDRQLTELEGFFREHFKTAQPTETLFILIGAMPKEGHAQRVPVVFWGTERLPVINRKCDRYTTPLAAISPFMSAILGVPIAVTNRAILDRRLIADNDRALLMNYGQLIHEFVAAAKKLFRASPLLAWLVEVCIAEPYLAQLENLVEVVDELPRRLQSIGDQRMLIRTLRNVIHWLPVLVNCVLLAMVWAQPSLPTISFGQRDVIWGVLGSAVGYLLICQSILFGVCTFFAIWLSRSFAMVSVAATMSNLILSFLLALGVGRREHLLLLPLLYLILRGREGMRSAALSAVAQIPLILPQLPFKNYLLAMLAIGIWYGKLQSYVRHQSNAGSSCLLNLLAAAIFGTSCVSDFLEDGNPAVILLNLAFCALVVWLLLAKLKSPQRLSIAVAIIFTGLAIGDREASVTLGVFLLLLPSWRQCWNTVIVEPNLLIPRLSSVPGQLEISLCLLPALMCVMLGLSRLSWQSLIRTGNVYSLVLRIVGARIILGLYSEGGQGGRATDRAVHRVLQSVCPLVVFWLISLTAPADGLHLLDRLVKAGPILIFASLPSLSSVGLIASWA